MLYKKNKSPFHLQLHTKMFVHKIKCCLEFATESFGKVDMGKDISLKLENGTHREFIILFPIFWGEIFKNKTFKTKT